MSATSSAVQRQLRLIDELDLEPIAFKLVHPEPGQPGLTIEEADRLILKYRRFLKLCAMYPEQSVVPSKEIDKVWHTHILDTAKYADDCNIVFGFMLHHFPYFGLRSEADQALLREQGTVTRELYKQHFDADMYDGSVENMDTSCSNAPSCTGDCSPSCAPSGSGLDSPVNARPRLVRA